MGSNLLVRQAPGRHDAGIDISIMIVGYNSATYLSQCMGAIAQAISNHSYEVLFVNNGTDESEELIGRDHRRVRVLQPLGNVGFAAGNNYLAAHAFGEWLLLLNPDTRLYPGALDALLDAATANPEYDVLGGITVDKAGEREALSLLRLPTLSSLLRTLFMGGDKSSTLQNDQLDIAEVEALNGGFMMVRRGCWEELGGLDASFFLYAEELDFFKRLKSKGGKAAEVPASLVFHDLGSGDTYSPHRVRFLFTGNAHYFHKHFSSVYAYACISVMWLTTLKRYIGGRLLSGRGERYARMSRGFAQVASTPWSWIRGYRSKGADPRKTS